MIQLHLVYDSVDIDLQAAGWTVRDGYYPRVGKNPDERVTDEIPVYFRGTAAQRSAANQSLNLAFEHARRWKDGASPVWLEFGIDASVSRWRAQVFDGTPMPDAKMNTLWKHSALRMNALVEREAGWSGPEEQLPITNGNGTNDTSGLRAYNDGSGSGSSPAKHDNYIQISGTDVDGDVPGTTRLELTYGKTGADGYNLQHLWIGHSWNSPANLVHYYDISGGNPVSIPSSVYGTTIASLSLTAATLNAAKGQVIKGMLRYNPFGSSAFDITYQMRLSSGGILVWEGPLVRTNTDTVFAVRDIGNLRLPPKPYTLGSLEGLTLEILAIQTTGETLTEQYLDFYLIPMDGFRFLMFKKRLLTGERVVDDGILGHTYQDNGSGGSRIIAAQTIGDAIGLYPGLDQRLYFLSHTDHGDILGSTNYLTCKVFYRPRRLGL